MLTGLSFTAITVLMIAGVLLDLLLGEAKRWHPLVGFGRLANTIEGSLNRGRFRTLRGVVAWCIAVVPMTLLACAGIASDTGAAVWLHVGLLYFSLGLRSLHDHTAPIQRALLSNDLPAARVATARIVSRDTWQADASALAKAGIESLLENGNDAVFGTLFWFMIAGGPGALLFRLANTLDAMWGYRTPRFQAFGWAAARIDDALNWIPARLTALSYALLGDTRSAWQCWMLQAPGWPSPNAGPVMAAGAGALGVALGGAAIYDGQIEHRPALGGDQAVAAEDIGRAWKLVAGTTALWLGVAVGCAIAIWLFQGNAHA
ncbi:MAG: adenosylcobinamide-phosphate synthase CbiB [Pseudomonadota bacterium]